MACLFLQNNKCMFALGKVTNCFQPKLIIVIQQNPANVGAASKKVQPILDNCF